MRLKTDIIDKLPIDQYRALPFWTWNGDLQEDELVKQVKWMKDNGFGGYFMHARGGLETEYLSEEWFQCIRACIQQGKKLGMDSLYYEIELPLCPVLYKMEKAGVAIDKEQLEQFGKMLSQRIADCEALIFGYADGPFNNNSTKQYQSRHNISLLSKY